VASKIKFYSVILAGGIGERLWPYSREDRPKQVIPFLNGESLLEQTINRCKLFSDQIFIITSQAQKDLISRFVKSDECKVLVEPAGRNTAAAIIFSLLQISKLDPNCIVGFFPADHYIPDSDVFASQIKKVVDLVSLENKICLLGLKPKSAATGYGYIECDLNDLENNQFLQIKKFHEKPKLEVAQQYVKDGNKFWNLGMFIAQINVFINECKFCAPRVFDQVTDSIEQSDKSIYEQIEKISIDYAVMEKTENIIFLPVDFAWSDVGNLDVFLSIQNSMQSSKLQNVIEINSFNNLIDVKDKLVALIGIENLCVIEHENQLIVINRKDVEKIKDLRQLIKVKKSEKVV